MKHQAIFGALCVAATSSIAGVDGSRFYLGLGGTVDGRDSTSVSYANLLHGGFGSARGARTREFVEEGLLAGNRFNSYSRTELGYSVSFDANAYFDLQPNQSALMTDSEPSVFNGAVTGIYSLNRDIGLFRKAGAAHRGVGGATAAFVASVPVEMRSGVGGTDTVGGSGGRYNLTDRALFNFDWEHDDSISGSGRGGSNDEDVIGGSLRHRF